MIVFKTTENLINQLDKARNSSKKSVGFVPTMGALHDGHFSLIKSAKKDNDIVVCSIFVNPTQFNNPEDFEKYPVTIEKDLQSLEGLGCDIVFVPDTNEMYGSKARLKFDFGNLESIMEGVHRPGHFTGVALIVSKLFHLVNPDKAYFGQKDLQQFAIISQLVRDLSFQVELVCCPTIREVDGLAMSSRNLRLSQEQRAEAPLLYKVLNEVRTILQQNKSVEDAVEHGKKLLANSAFEVEYLNIVGYDSLQPVNGSLDNEKLAICIAAKIGEIRLIDNIVFDM